MRALAPLALALVASMACTSHGGPRPSAIAPAAVSGDAPAQVEIAGAGFEARVQTDFAAGEGTIDGGFEAWLVPSGGGAQVALQGVALTVRRTLLATVPAGVAHGLYDLVVVDPAAGRGCWRPPSRWSLRPTACPPSASIPSPLSGPAARSRSRSRPWTPRGRSWTASRAR